MPSDVFFGLDAGLLKLLPIGHLHDNVMLIYQYPLFVSKLLQMVLGL